MYTPLPSSLPPSFPSSHPPSFLPSHPPSILLSSLLCQWYKDNPGRMKQSCRHKALHLHSDTPADFFRVDFTPTQDDSQEP